MPEKYYQPSVIRSIQRQNAKDSAMLHRRLAKTYRLPEGVRKIQRENARILDDLLRRQAEAMRLPGDPRPPRPERIPGPNPRSEAMSRFRV